MPWGRNLILSFLYIAIVVNLTAQEAIELPRQFRFNRLSVEQGLSQINLQRIKQDKNGFMWFATRDGLNRYDGYSFKIFRNDSSTASILDNELFDLEFDSIGNLWVSSASGLSLYLSEAEEFANYPFEIDTLKYHGYNGIYLWDKNNLAVYTRQGIFFFNLKTKKYEWPGIFKPFIGRYISDLRRMQNGDVWLTTEKELYIYTPQSDQFEEFSTNKSGRYYLPFKLPLTNSSTNGKSIHRDSLATYIASGEGLFRWMPVERSFKSVAFNQLRATPKRFFGVMRDHENKLWIFCDDVIILNDQDSVVAHLVNDASNNTSPSRNIYCGYQSREGIVWLGSYSDGVCIYNPFTSPFNTLNTELTSKPQLAQEFVTCVYAPDENQIFVGSFSGIDLLNPIINKITHSFSMENYFYSTPSIHCMLRDSTGSVWVGTSEGIIKYRNATNFRKELSDFYVHDIKEFRPGELILGTSKGLVLLNSTTLKITKRIPPPGDIDLTQQLDVDAIHKEADTYWVGTHTGLYLYNEKKGFFRSFKHEPGNSKTLAANFVKCIFRDSKKRLWVGTWGGGLDLFNSTDSTFRHFTLADGLPNMVVYGILEDQDGRLWMSTNLGLSLFHPELKKFINFDYQDGIQSNEFNTHAYSKSPSGIMYFGGIRGLTYFDPSRFKNFPESQKPFIINFFVNQEKVNLEKSSNSFAIEVPWNSSNIGIEVSSIQFIASYKTQYRFKLENFDADWQKPSLYRFINYTNLPPGKYVFKSQARNLYGNWSTTSDDLLIIIKPPFWQTVFFRITAPLSLLIVIVIVVRARINRIRQAEKLKTESARKMADLEMSALRAQMNPHFIFNSLNSINRYVSKADPETASSYLTKFSHLMRLILDGSKNKTVSLAQDLESLKLYIELEMLRFGNNRFTYTIEINGAIHAERTQLPPMLIQPFVENAIWHGLQHKKTPGHIDIQFRKEKGYLICIIEDNGIGRKNSLAFKNENNIVNRKSYGIDITIERLALFNEEAASDSSSVQITDLEDKMKQAAGTRVALRIVLIETE